MWICSNCNEELPDQFDSCWKCQTYKSSDHATALLETAPLVSSERRTQSVSSPQEPSASQHEGAVVNLKKSNGKSDCSESVMLRYYDAYLVAKATILIGAIIKFVGTLVAIVTLSGGLYMASQAEGYSRFMFSGIGFVAAVIEGVLFFIFGVLVSAQGQVLKASLDAAVNSSPFLDDDQRANVMSL